MNISEFAVIAGVSKSAVSRYFNNGYLSADKKEKIEEALKKTGYAPSAAARTVKTRVTKLVGVIIPKLSSESCSKVAEGISDVLDAQGYKLLLVNTANDSHKEIESLELFRQNRVDGVILLATVFSDLHKAVMKKMRVPFVIVGQEMKGFNCVCHNDEGAAFALTKLMIEKGVKKPGIIGVTRDDAAAGAARWNGFLNAVAKAGLTFNEDFSEMSEFTMDSGYRAAKRLFSHRERPDGVFCATDTIAAGAELYCRENGISIPDDVMMCAIGDSKMGRVAYPSLTTAHLHYKTAGKEAAEMLLHAIKNGDEIQRILQLDFDIIERDSTS
ncbi:MAG: LacI family DNA-binding transcriptional regulator [Firmicutes bacterium]|nr:LacI family DNA-binding transcriptional regulator [Bacillota bacterium]